MEFQKFKRTKSDETRIVSSIKKQIKLSKESNIHKANLIIISISFLIAILFIIIGYIYLGLNWNDNLLDGGIIEGNDGGHGIIWSNDGELYVVNWLYIFLIPASSLAAYSGIVAVIASNNKSPVKFLILSTITILYRISFVIAQYITQPETGGGVNTTLLVGQPAFFLMLLGQTYLWIKWNNEGEGGKFQSEALKGKRAQLAWVIVATVSLCLLFFSIETQPEGATILSIIIDVAGSSLYMIGAILNAFGNILCFPFFFLGNLSYLYWGLIGLFNNEPLMTIFSLTTILQTIGLNALLITGFIQWFNEDFIWKKGEGIKSKSNLNNTKETKFESID